MCGILGVISKEQFSIYEMIERLKRLEYRGYDSAGFVTKEGILKKVVGEIDKLKAGVPDIKTNLMILHTRWATHGKVTKDNAHPHSDCTGKIHIVHNGTIDNYNDLREELEKKGHRFRSETDSEIFAHFIEEGLKNGKNINEIFREIFEKFEGTYAVLVLVKGENKLYAVKNGSPLVLGISEDKIYIASDVYAFLDETQRVIILDDYEFVEVEI